jgi:hypothetical protein
MRHGSGFTRLRHYRFAIGLIAAIALLFGPMLTIAAATADPFQDYLNAHLCGPSSAKSGPGAPAVPSEHRHDCQLCGPGCPMGGCSAPAALSGGVVSIAVPTLHTSRPVGSKHAIQPTRSLYPSDTLSQGPPLAA